MRLDTSASLTLTAGMLGGHRTTMFVAKIIFAALISTTAWLMMTAKIMDLDTITIV